MAEYRQPPSQSPSDYSAAINALYLRLSALVSEYPSKSVPALLLEAGKHMASAVISIYPTASFRWSTDGECYTHLDSRGRPIINISPSVLFFEDANQSLEDHTVTRHNVAVAIGAMCHELAHAMFTFGEGQPGVISKPLKTHNAFLPIWNVVEDLYINDSLVRGGRVPGFEEVLPNLYRWACPPASSRRAMLDHVTGNHCACGAVDQYCKVAITLYADTILGDDTIEVVAPTISDIDVCGHRHIMSASELVRWAKDHIHRLSAKERRELSVMLLALIGQLALEDGWLHYRKSMSHLTERQILGEERYTEEDFRKYIPPEYNVLQGVKEARPFFCNQHSFRLSACPITVMEKSRTHRHNLEWVLSANTQLAQYEGELRKELGITGTPYFGGTEKFVGERRDFDLRPMPDLVGLFRRLILSRENHKAYSTGGHYSGKLDGRRLHRLSVGSDAVFRLPEDRLVRGGAVGILIDSSGSMMTHLKNAISLGHALWQATHRERAYAVKVSAFAYNITDIEFMDGKAVAPSAYGGTFGYSAIGSMASALSRLYPGRPRLVVVITDGRFGDDPGAMLENAGSAMHSKPGTRVVALILGSKDRINELELANQVPLGYDLDTDAAARAIAEFFRGK